MERYSRQLVLPHFGEAGQEKLAAAAVLVIGAGGLGCPALQYLAAAGVATIGIADGDVVSLSNLQRQVLYTMESIGQPKVEAAIQRLKLLNPGINFSPYPFYLRNTNILEIIKQYDLVIDGSDNFSARYLVNDACVLTGKPLVHGSVSGFEGQLAVFNSGPGTSTNYRDLFPEMPGAGETGSCEERGVLGVLPGIIGTLQAAEAIKIICGIGEPITDSLLTFNLLRNEWLSVQIPAGGSQQLIPATEAAFMAQNYDDPSSCAAEYINIGPAEFDILAAKGEALIIDVREKDEQPLVTGFNYLNIPLMELKSKASAYHNRSIVLFCHSGIRSITAAGFFPADNVIYNLKGGIIKWLNQQ